MLIWIQLIKYGSKLSVYQKFFFGVCYVPPSDSEYFDYAHLSKIQERVKSNKCNNGCFIIGNRNSRLGLSVKDLPRALDYRAYSYPVVPDPVPTPNGSATAMLGVCIEEQLLVIINLRTSSAHFMSKRLSGEERSGYHV